MMKAIKSHTELLKTLKQNDQTFVLLYKSGAEQSDCALKNLKNLEIKNTAILTADVASVRDIHIQYAITSVPSFLEFKGKDFKNNYKGCQSGEYYKNLVESSLFKISAKDDKESSHKPVTVYSTPTCSWCTTLKNHLNKHGVRYTDIDISKNQSAAQSMMARSGQQGVPQTDIGGEMIVGFDKNRINLLLEI